MSNLVRMIASSTLLICLWALPGPSWAAKGDCGQPVTNGAVPTASDCLFILQTAVGSQTCGDNPCICDTGGGPGVTASDALLCLKKAVDPDHVVLTCHCAVTTTSTSTSSTTSSSTTTSTTIPPANMEGTGAADVGEAPAAAPVSALLTVSAEDASSPPEVSGVETLATELVAQHEREGVCRLPQS